MNDYNPHTVKCIFMYASSIYHIFLFLSLNLSMQLMLVTQDSVVPFKGKWYFLLEFAARQALFYKMVVQMWVLSLVWK